MTHLSETESKAFFECCETMAGHLRAGFGGRNLMTHVRLLDGAPIIHLCATETNKGVAKFANPLNLVLRWRITTIKSFLANPTLNLGAFIDDLDSKLALWERALVFDGIGLSQRHSGAKHLEVDRVTDLPFATEPGGRPPSGS